MSKYHSRWLLFMGRLRGLIIISGFLMLISATPVGLIIGAEDFLDERWRTGLLVAAIIMSTVAFVGGLMMYLGVFIVKRRRRVRELRRRTG